MDIVKNHQRELASS